jgi:hypothetical protein
MQCGNKFFVAINADSMLTQDNMWQPEVAFCFMSGATPRQEMSVRVAPTPQSGTVLDNHMFVTIFLVNQAILFSILFFKTSSSID